MREGLTMSRLLLLEEFHLSFLMVEDMPEDQVEAVRRILNSPNVRSALRTAILQVITARPELAELRVRLSR
jgi:hypothetical protein